VLPDGMTSTEIHLSQVALAKSHQWIAAGCSSPAGYRFALSLIFLINSFSFGSGLLVAFVSESAVGMVAPFCL
jgi:hypothetical protein